MASSEDLSVTVAVGPCALVGIILLVVLFCDPESGHRLQQGDHLVSFVFQAPDAGFCDCFFPVGGIKDSGAVLCPDIRSLAVGLGKIVRFKEQLHQGFIVGLFRIVCYFNAFQMAGGAGLDLGVGWMVYISAHKSDGGCFHAGRFHEPVFRSPKTA